MIGEPSLFLFIFSKAVSKPQHTIATAAAFHSSAILCTLFRLWYRWSMACMWWDDVWAVVALLADAASLISIVLGQFMFDSKTIVTSTYR